MRLRPALACLAAALAAGCAADSPQPRYYVLTAETRTAAPIDAGAPSIAVGPVTVPDVIDRPRMVVQGPGNQVLMSEYNRWASPVKTEIANVIGRNLTLDLGATKVWSYMQASIPNPDVQVLVDVRRFDATLDQGVSVDVLWAIKRKAGEPVKSGQTIVSEKAAAAYDGLVAAYSKAMAQVSRDIAAAIRTR